MARPLYGTATYGTDGYGYTFDRVALVTIDHTKVGSSTLADFPVCIKGTFPFLANVSNGGGVRHSSGYDIIFTAGADVLSHDIEKYDPATGEIVVWIKVPSLSNTVDTVITIRFGCADITTSQEDKAGTWNSNFKGVYHLGDGSTISAADSTSNGYTGTVSGATAATGLVHGGSSFDGVNDKVTLGAVHDYSVSIT